MLGGSDLKVHYDGTCPICIPGFDGDGCNTGMFGFLLATGTCAWLRSSSFRPQHEEQDQVSWHVACTPDPSTNSTTSCQEVSCSQVTNLFVFATTCRCRQHLCTVLHCRPATECMVMNPLQHSTHQPPVLGGCDSHMLLLVVAWNALRHIHLSKRAGSSVRLTITRAATVNSPRPAAPGPIILNGQVLHSIEPHRLDVIHSMEQDGWVAQELTKLLKPVAKCWQPADLLPDGADDDFLDQVLLPGSLCLSMCGSIRQPCMFISKV
jgi:hypothetical protein